jgi:ketosteroid isomerase-like protein
VTPEEIDALFDRHCAGEAANDVAAVMATLADGAQHDVVGDPEGVLTDPASIEKRYLTLFESFADETLTPLRRYYGGDFFVDESLFEGKIVSDFMGLPGQGRHITFRILHVCETRDGLISRENVWMDAAAVIAQLSSPAQ